MTPADLDLARALVAHLRWEWRAGMRTAPWSAEDCDVIRVLHVQRVAPGHTVGHGPRDETGIGHLQTEAGDVPDLDDPATAGVLLGMLQEALSADVFMGQRFEGSTLGAAVARCLLSVWGAA